MKQVLLCIAVLCITVAVVNAAPSNLRSKLLEIIHKPQKRFGCWHYECPEGTTCKENRHGDAYCMEDRDIDNVKRNDIYKRFGCWHYECPEGTTCHENRHGDAFCLPDDHYEKDADQHKKDLDIVAELVRKLEDTE